MTQAEKSSKLCDVYQYSNSKELDAEIRRAWQNGDLEEAEDESKEDNKCMDHSKKMRLQEEEKEAEAEVLMREEEEAIANGDMIVHIIDVSEENHKKYGEYVKSIIYGGLDGIITTFAVVSAVHGANLEPETVLVLGFANLIADGFSMGMGDYLSESAEYDFARSERDREKWEFENFQEGEILEMIEIYETKGITKEDAEVILRTMAKYPDFFIDHMLIEELNIQPVEEHESAIKNGLATMASFLIFGSIPLLSYAVMAPIHLKSFIFIIIFIIVIPPPSLFFSPFFLFPSFSFPPPLAKLIRYTHARYAYTLSRL
ncbi:hypothetical protein RFI_08923 [Reticulomyxa filosa]|uniref:Uncharacterized protein n=1 Tax=Reticulomyxa filosa TaxID=46433 RepID=X6NPJ3_RETFI|nr:hypothetical protein RFI_08923 [Reticulomyxa filosa]|eukprot:ETO28210.1 hypothetical protein RFI_08923 [Reticulomyxa filosa]